ncbi:MAG: M50 family metallopeptidase [Lachnospiraceae bacterium]|nr:M50 family metallopeptidase [Lachnospiraceae bacterium]MDY5742753.1 M50 family metallopeptidase [Lachnospiraceae bacterium]
MGILIAIIIFGFLVFFHELGHFIFAVRSGIEVIEFSIGMGPRLWSRKGKLTTYSLKLLPLGGSCMMKGEDEEDDSAGTFLAAGIWGRIATVAAGPVFNFILAFLLSLVLVGWQGTSLTKVSSMEEKSAAAEAGMRKGDRIVSINGSRMTLAQDVILYNRLHQGEKYSVVIERDGTEQTLQLTPQKDSESGAYRVGIGFSKTKVGFWRSIQYAFYEMIYWIKLVFLSLGLLFSGRVGVGELSGPVGLISGISNTYQESRSFGVSAAVISMLTITVMLSANLGVMNLLPIPALDGGRLLFLFWELITRRPLPRKLEGYLNTVGFILLIGLMLYVTFFNDIMRLFR